MRARTEGSDLVLPLAVVAVVGMMVFPLPSAILDTLLVANISFALVLLVSCVYLAQPERFTSLPSILLLSTLFRLGLNISTTRQLLSVGEAPLVVQAFGDFVVQGNLVVGVVVFLIVSLVQFMVIAKGAERVAEVAARFTLDAMPGKQMSIDADVRSGVISLTEARARRLELHRESKLFGALDGAMKFVKGDAIAGLVITFINITAGLAVGVLQRGMGLSEAAHRYTLFTIGDGLASQVPALLVAVSAGIAVTRVSEKDDSFIGRDMFSQLAREPQALAASGGLLGLLALLPGLPFLPFSAAGAFLLLLAWSGKEVARQSAIKEEEAAFRPRVGAGLLLRASPGAALRLQRERSIVALFQTLRSEAFDTLGVLVPELQFSIETGWEGERVGLAFRGAEIEVLEGGSVELSGAIINALRPFAFEHAERFCDDSHTRRLLEIHASAAEDLVNSVVPQMITVTGLTTVLRGLIAEQVSIHELPTVLQAVAEFYHERSSGGGVKQPVPGSQAQFRELLAVVRISLSSQVADSVRRRFGRLRAHLLSVTTDFALLAASEDEGRAAETSERLVTALRGTEDLEVLVTSKFARLEVASLCRAHQLPVSVVAVEEIEGCRDLEVAGEVSPQELDCARAA